MWPHMPFALWRAKRNLRILTHYFRPIRPNRGHIGQRHIHAQAQMAPLVGMSLVRLSEVGTGLQARQRPGRRLAHPASLRAIDHRTRALPYLCMGAAKSYNSVNRFFTATPQAVAKLAAFAPRVKAA